MEPVFLTGGRRRRRVACAVAAFFVALALLIDRRAIINATRFPNDDHASASLDQAVNLAFCRATGVLSATFNPSRHLRNHPEDLALGMSDLIVTHAGSVRQYCDGLTYSFINNENALMLMTSAAWTLRPAWSADAVGKVLLWTRVFAVALFGAACLEAGMSFALGFLVIVGAIVVLGEVNQYQYRVYAFLLVIPLVWAAFCSLASRNIGRRASITVAAIGATGGVVAAFLANLRTSYWPLLVASFLLMIVEVARARTSPVRNARRFTAAAVAGFVVGAAAFQLAVIRPIQRSSSGRAENYTYHTVAHPLVMALAVPPNDLSGRESIRWDDSSGAEIATRVIPGVRFLGPEYETALYRYYFGLWRSHPDAMLRTYWMKLRSSGQGVFLQAAQLVPDWRPLRRVYLVWADRVNGFLLLIAALACTALAVWRSVAVGSPTALLVSLLGLTTVLLLAEAAIIYSTFFLAYHSFLMLMVLLAPAAAVQALADVVRSTFGRESGQPA